MAQFPCCRVGFFAHLPLDYIQICDNEEEQEQPGELGLPPGPRPWPVIGNLHLLVSLPHKSLAEPIMFLRLGSVPTVVASSPAMAEEFLKTHELIFANRPTSAMGKYLAYERRDMAQAPYWWQMKKLCTIELLTAKRTESFRWVREEEVSAMVRSVWEESKKIIRYVELRKPIYSVSFNIVCRMFAGKSYCDHHLSGGQGFLQMLGEIMHLAGVVVLGDFIPSLTFLDWRGHRRRMKAVHKVFDAFAEKLIDEQSGEGRKKTSATPVEWVMTELLRNPKVMARAQQDIELEVGRDRIVRESDLVNSDYLRCVVKETFRLHPPGPLLVPHESTEGCNVGGYYIPPKTRLFVNAWAMGRDESVWEDAASLILWNEKEKEVKNLSLVKSCSAEKKVAEVIPDDGADLKKDLVDGSVSKVVPNGSKVRVMVANKMNYSGRTRSDLQKKEGGNKRESTSVKHGERGEV
ncbi:cytochrome P450 750A1-like [Cryptomeria japonica]|uniref:cytochrome P450 750A1-like n=1 Tax=Cryptomeria japonica TaxID=3369 RepID=UPI0027DA78A5|nr:cytochrome P450 750A1-like [Cryptomeria japonica]